MRLKIALVALLPLLGACVTMPLGPSVLVLPGAGKSFEDFDVDNGTCQDWAAQQIGANPQQSGQNRAIQGAAIGTLAGAAAGAAIGAAVGNPGAGAAIGAGSGLVLGGASSVDAGQNWAYLLQQRYDNAFQQCMYAKGNQIPMAASMAPATNSYDASPSRPSESPSHSGEEIPPPPPGSPPPPPPS